jgi:hypothetical protein
MPLWEVSSGRAQRIVPFYGERDAKFCLFSSFLLFKTRYVRYLMAFRWIFFMRFLMVDFGIFMWASLLMECSCMAPLTPAVMVIRGFVCHPRFCMVLINGSYLLCLCVRAWSGNLSWQYVNSMNWIVSLEEGAIGVCVWFGAPIMHSMSGLSLGWHWHVVCVHVHWRSQSGIVCSGGLLFKWPALVNVKKRVFLWACNVWVMRCTALLCLAILRPFRYRCSYVDRMWGLVSMSLRGQCAIGVLVCEGPEDMLCMVTHVLCVSKV